MTVRFLQLESGINKRKIKKVIEDTNMDKMKEYSQKHNLINKGDRIVVAFSGGPDSVYLMLKLLAIQQEMELTLVAVYINHKLLKEADEHAKFVRRFCDQYDISLYYFEKDIASYAKKEKLSIEEAGRKFRYQKFYEVLEQLHYDSIAVAHHQDDQAETVLYRMARGTGWKGMAGIRPKQNKIIRPLLGVSKQEILAELEQMKQSYNVDPSNQDTVYARNQIRHLVLPDLSVVNQQAREHIAKLAEQMEELGDYIELEIEQLWNHCVVSDKKQWKINIPQIKNSALFLQKEILKRALAEASGLEKDLSRTHVNQLLLLMTAQTGKRMDFPYNVWAVRQYDWLVLQKQQKKENIKIPIQGEGRYEIPFADGFIDVKILQKKEEFSQKLYTKTFDYDKIKESIVVRSYEKDDYFIMNRQGQHKRINRYFIDQKIPGDQRGKIPLVADGSHIIWIIGGRISEAYKVTKETTRVMQLTWVQMEEV